MVLNLRHSHWAFPYFVLVLLQLQLLHTGIGGVYSFMLCYVMYVCNCRCIDVDARSKRVSTGRLLCQRVGATIQYTSNPPPSPHTALFSATLKPYFKKL